MKTLLLGALLGLAGATLAQTQSLADYEYQAARAPVGTVVHYLKSNLDGSKRLVLSQHFSGPLSLEVLKVEADGQYLALVQAELDPKTLSERRLRSFNGLERGSPREQMRLETDAAGRLVAAVAQATLPVMPAHHPVHLYNFDLAGLNATLPHLRNPRADFEVGIVDPDFEFLRTRFRPDGGEQTGGLVNKGNARFKYLRDEVLDEIPTHRFEVSGPAFQGLKGTLWVNARDRLIERFEHAVPDNPEWNSLRLSRIGARKLDAAGWEAFKAATVQRARVLRDEE